MIGKHLCVQCAVEHRVEKNGVIAVSMGEYGPLECYCADLWRCPVCGHRLVTGLGLRPLRVGAMEVEEYIKEQVEELDVLVFRFFLNQNEREMFESRVSHWQDIYPTDNFRSV